MADRARLDQLIKGAFRSDLMILNLGLRDRRDNPPTFLELLSEICLEEHEASRRRLQPARAAYAKCATVSPDPELKDLKTEVHKLRVQVNELYAAQALNAQLGELSALPAMSSPSRAPVCELCRTKHVKSCEHFAIIHPSGRRLGREEHSSSKERSFQAPKTSLSHVS